MLSSWMTIRVRRRWIAAAIVCFMSGCVVFAGPVVFAQNAAPPVALEPASAPPPPAPQPEKTGVFESIGRWFDQGASNFRDHLRGAKRKMDDLGDEAAANSKGFGDQAATAGKNAAEVTKSAVDGLAKLPAARIMNGRERCITAPNGAPDCLAAAEALCRKHGFTTGKSMDFTSADECPARALLGGSQPGAECKTVTFISRAMCQ